MGPQGPKTEKIGALGFHSCNLGLHLARIIIVVHVLRRKGPGVPGLQGLAFSHPVLESNFGVCALDFVYRSADIVASSWAHLLWLLFL